MDLLHEGDLRGIWIPQLIRSQTKGQPTSDDLQFYTSFSKPEPLSVGNADRVQEKCWNFFRWNYITTKFIAQTDHFWGIKEGGNLNRLWPPPLTNPSKHLMIFFSLIIIVKSRLSLGLFTTNLFSRLWINYYNWRNLLNDITYLIDDRGRVILDWVENKQKLIY